MEAFELLNYFRDNSTSHFPQYSHVRERASATIKRSLAAALALPADIDATALLVQIAAQAEPIGRLGLDDPDSATRTIGPILDDLGIELDRNVYINWRRFDNIDEVRLRDVLDYFDYLWYPSSEDIELFDNTCSWIATVRHDGAVCILRIRKTG